MITVESGWQTWTYKTEVKSWDLGSASDLSCRVGNLIQPIKSTTQIWVRFSDVNWRGNQWQRREMTAAVFSGYWFCWSANFFLAGTKFCVRTSLRLFETIRVELFLLFLRELFFEESEENTNPQKSQKWYSLSSGTSIYQRAKGLRFRYIDWGRFPYMLLLLGKRKSFVVHSRFYCNQMNDLFTPVRYLPRLQST